jgi:hypothetical protein
MVKIRGGTMRVLRLLLFVFVFSVPLLAQKATTATPAPRDPQALAVVQAAITALGGTTAIGQANSWNLQGTVQGPAGAIARNEVIDRQSGPTTVAVNGVTKPSPKLMASSLFLPSLVGAVLAQEFQDPKVGMEYRGTSTLGSEAVTSVTFSRMNSIFAIAQVWIFSNKTSLPVRVLFRVPAHIGQTSSFSGVVDLSDYRPFLGGLYAFSLVTRRENRPTETITLQSVTPAQ